MLDSFLSQVIDNFPVVVDRQTSLQSAIAAMQRANFTAIWVTAAHPGQTPQLIGAVFPEQLLQALSTVAQPTETTIDAIVRVDLPLLTQAHLATVASAVEWLLAQFEAYQVDCLPLVNHEGTFLGAVNQWKLLQVCCHRESPEQLAQWLAKSQIGFFTMMLDQPLPWNARIDRASALDEVFVHQRIRAVNEAMASQYGLSPTELIGQTPADFFAHDLTYGKQVWQRLFDLGVMSETTDERRFDEPTAIWIEGFYRCLYDPQGCVLGHLGIQRDVTVLKHLQSHLLQQERYLQIVVEIQQTLLASGHRLMTDYLSHPENLHESWDDALTQFSFRSVLSDLRSLYQTLLRQLGITAQASRVYLAEHAGKGHMSLQLAWQAPDMTPQAEPPSKLPWLEEPYPAEWLARLAVGQVIYVCPAELPAGDRPRLAPSIRAMLVLPLMIEGQLWGTLGLENRRETELWGDGEVKLLTAAAAVMAMHLENCQAIYQLHKAWHRERCTRLLVERIRQTLRLEDIVETTTRELRQLLDCDRTVIYRFNSDWSGNFIAESVAPDWLPLAQIYCESPQLEGATVSDDDDCSVQYWQPAMLLAADTYLQDSRGGDYRQGKPYSCVGDIDQTDFDPCYPTLIKQMQAVAYLTVPIFLGDRLWGLLANYQNRGPRQWSGSDISLARQIATQLGVALQHVELFEQTRRQALELAQAKLDAEAASQTRKEFMANVSHELRTPLNAILGFSQILAEELATLPLGAAAAPLAEFQEYVDIINRNGHNLLGLVNNVLDMARLESGQHQLSLSRFDLHQLLQDLESALAPRAEKKGIQLNVRHEPHLPSTITSDREKLFRVLFNLLNNAIESTPTGSVTLRVSVLTQQNLDAQTSRYNLAFEVEDTGPGIDSEALQSLFQPVSDASITGASNLKSGLSLAVSRQLINRLGGDISVSSTFNHGSLFRCNIWAIADRPSAGAQPPTDQSVTATVESPLLAHRLLIIDTQPQNHAALQACLEQIGCELKRARNGDEALVIWRDWHPHLMLIEPDLAIVEGRLITQHIRQHKAEPQIKTAMQKPVLTKVIALKTGAASLAGEELIANFDDVLEWPTQNSTLLQLLIKGLLSKNAQTLQLSLTHELAKQDLATTSLQWRELLYQAALTGSDQKLLSLISQLSEEQALLAKILTAFTVDFQFSQILALLANDENS